MITYLYLTVARNYSNSAVKKAGDFIAGTDASRRIFSSDEAAWGRLFDENFEVVKDWRDIHAAPLRIVSRRLAKRAKEIYSEAITAQRLKTFRSIRSKLVRSKQNNLTTMQDIAGCRAIVRSVADAYELKAVYEHEATSASVAGRPQLVGKWTKDYIASPKPDGYRSLHLVQKFHTSQPDLGHCDGLRIEIQIRSQMQHAWAMAVETASALTDQALKSGIGHDDWKRFFWLVGDIIAFAENAPLICGREMSALRKEAAGIARKLRVIPILQDMQHVIESFSSFEGGASDMYLLELNSRDRTIVYDGFPKEEFKRASEQYARRESEIRESEDIHVVLVAVSALNELRSAYPSYFLDSSGFIDVMQREIYGQQ
jgi:ppGpp synthetase/RelA/SpoT-type nucleotidyltranferase